MNIHTQVENLENYKKFLAVEQATREFLQKTGYLRIELPALSSALVPESYLEIFETEFRYLDKKEKMYLTPSPELFLKRLLAYGIGDCYYLGKSYRNGEESSKHSPEFMMLEFYKVNANYLDVAEETLKLVQHICKEIFGKHEFIYQGKKINVSKWEKYTVAEAFEKYAQMPMNKFVDRRAFIDEVRRKNYRTEGFSFEEIFSQVYVQEIEPNLGQNGYPTLLYDYPVEFAALAKSNPDGKTSQRFEFYIAGIELGDCYSELTDAVEQKKRFDEEVKKRRESGKIDHKVDDEFIEVLEHGLPQCSGIAIGFERLAMIFADLTAIDDLKLLSIR